MRAGFLAALLLALLAGAGGVRAAAPGGAAPRGDVPVTPALLAEFRADPDAFYFELRHVEAVACARRLLADRKATRADSLIAYRGLGLVYAGLKSPAASRAAFARWLALDPAGELTPAAFPPGVVRIYFAVKDSLARLGRSGPAGGAEGAAIHTLAIGPIDNRALALPGQKFDYGRFAAGLTQMVTSDLMPATQLRVVDRQRLRVLMDEIGMGRGAAFDRDSAVRAGKLLGAQSFLFGSLTSPGNNLVRLDLRLVQTETGEILLSASKEKKIGKGEDLLELERAVVESLAKRLDQVIAEAGGAKSDVGASSRKALKQRTRQSGNAMDLVDRTGAAILAEDAGRPAEALEHWRGVLTLDPANTLARDRIRALDTEQRYAAVERGGRG